MGVTPVVLVGATHPEHFKDVQKMSEKWEKRTKGLQSAWPKEGTSHGSVCEDMALRFEDYKPKDKSEKLQEKRELELKILDLIKDEGEHCRKNVKEGLDELRNQHVRIDNIW